jgi:hypothetical protein
MWLVFVMIYTKNTMTKWGTPVYDDATIRVLPLKPSSRIKLDYDTNKRKIFVLLLTNDYKKIATYNDDKNLDLLQAGIIKQTQSVFGCNQRAKPLKSKKNLVPSPNIFGIHRWKPPKHNQNAKMSTFLTKLVKI